ncbi:hypothetical protein VQZ12_004684 [Salmonella enterica]|nr:hypothetical protein [Salmonella enterica]EMD3918221.1 hypothetical protein [Salmonella enterica]
MISNIPDHHKLHLNENACYLVVFTFLFSYVGGYPMRPLLSEKFMNSGALVFFVLIVTYAVVILAMAFADDLV